MFPNSWFVPTDSGTNFRIVTFTRCMPTAEHGNLKFLGWWFESTHREISDDGRTEETCLMMKSNCMCQSSQEDILRILGLEAWVARWIWANDLTMSGGVGIHGCFKYNCLWHEGSIPSSWTIFKMALHRAYPLAGMKFICNSSMPKYKDALVQIQSFE